MPFIKGLVTVGLLFALARGLDLGRVADLLSQARWSFGTAAVVIMLVQALVAVVRWRIVMVHQAVRQPFSRSMSYFWLGLFFNQVLPSSVGGDAMRAYCLIRDGCGIGKASTVVLLDRLFGMAGLVLLVLACLPWSLGFFADELAQWGVTIVAVGAAGVLLCVLLLDRVTSLFHGWRIARGLSSLSRGSREMLLSPPLATTLLSISIAVHLFSILGMAMLAVALQVEVHWAAFAFVVPIASLLMTLPISVAGWGIREGVMVVGLRYAGIDAEHAIALSVLYGLVLVAVALPGGILWLLSGRSKGTDEKPPSKG